MRILVAMSGGVDSATVAGLLHEAGHEVIGVTLQLYDHGRAVGRAGSCCAGQDIYDARRVADHLGIPHYVIDAEARFRQTVIEDFVESYARGETPVPCARCNEGVKFGDLFALARDLGAEALATGHYVRRLEGEYGPELHRARDLSRDQSWFLYGIRREALAFCRFPLGDHESKAAVRAEASRLGLPVAAKPDSQDICFVPSGRYTDLIAKLRPEALTPGPIVTEAGEVVGTHQGLARYTVGQARHLGTAAQRAGEPYVVVGLDAAANRVIVAPRHRAGVREIRLRAVNWLIDPPAAPLACAVKLRARETPQPAEIWAASEGGAVVRLGAPALAAPGQACVFYEGTRLLGGGIIAGGVTAQDATREEGGGVDERAGAGVLRSASAA